MRSSLNLITVEEYLDLEQDAEIRHKYVAGQVYAMAGASEAHNLIVTNLIAILRPHLRGSSCRTFVLDMKVKFKMQQADEKKLPKCIASNSTIFMVKCAGVGSAFAKSGVWGNLSSYRRSPRNIYLTCFI